MNTSRAKRPERCLWRVRSLLIASIASTASAASVASGCAHPRADLGPPVPGAQEAVASAWAEPLTAWNRRWREIVLNGKTNYAIVTLDTRQCLRAESHAAASILLMPTQFNPDKFEWLTWEWRVDQLVDREALERRDGSDGAARVYIYFDTPGFSWQRHNINYVWSAIQPIETMIDSPFTPKISKILIAESGPEHVGTWQTVSRNVQDDYERAFGKEVPRVVAIGIMTDTDNTGSHALAYFSNLRVTRRAPSAP